MKFTLSWLNEHIKLNNSAVQVSELLTNLGLEVESLDDLNENFKNFLVSKIVKIKKHPNADRLKVCEINYGKENFKVVCGASNAVEGLKTIFAPNGTYIPGINSEKYKIKYMKEKNISNKLNSLSQNKINLDLTKKYLQNIKKI